MEDKVMAARNQAGDYFKNGANCAEAILLTFREASGTALPPEIMQIATGFGGGIGHAGCVCGALSGAIMVLGLYKGRTSLAGDRNVAYELAQEFHDRFKTTFGATCCRQLNKHAFSSPEHRRNCLKLVGNTARLLAVFIAEKQLS
ncbi:MAG: C-GCAxxG-C-C family protein [Heliobacteriaceae bacterium]|nr:C-GCAxxG-C-C family protein [Heliobacteriaceae bacterium]